MAVILRGKRKGETVALHQWANDWMMLADSTILAPTSLSYTPDERARIDADTRKGNWRYEWSGDRLVPARSRRTPWP